MSRPSMRSILFGLAAAATLISIQALAADTKKAAKPEAMDPAMQEMMKLAAPGPAHDKLKMMEGKWKAVTKSWMAPGEPTVTEGTSENRLILGGRFLEQHLKGTFNGQPYEGYGLTGYDNKKGQYNTMWVDNMATSMMTADGTMDAAGQDLTVKSTTTDGPDGKPTDFRMVTHIVDDRRHVFSMYATMNGKEQLMMETTYTRM